MGDAVVETLVGPGRTLVAEKKAVISISPDEEMSYLSVSFASVMPQRLIKSDAEHVRFAIVQNETEKPLAGVFPLVARFEATNDVVIIGIKQSVVGTYIMGIPVSTLIAWRPPQGTRDEISEDGVFLQFKMPCNGLQSLAPLEKTATHDLPSMLDKLLSHCPTFRRAGIKSAKELRNYAAAGYEKAVKAACLAGEGLARAAANDKGTATRGKQNEGPGGGAEAKEKWTALRDKLLGQKKSNVALPFEQRYLIMPVDAEMKPTTDGIAQLKEQLKYAVPCRTLPASLICSHPV